MPLSAVNKRVISAIVQIFETGKYTAISYGAVANIKGDSGGLSYGQHQASLTSGNLYLLLQRYIDAKGAYAKDIAAFMPRIKNRDRSVGNVTVLVNLLRQAGSDPIMQLTQDDFFYQQFMEPAVDAAVRYGFVLPTSYAVIYDSFIHGSWGAMRDRTLEKARIADEKNWIKTYLDTRRAWLVSKGKPLSGTVYRPDTFLALIKANNWQLNLPILCHGVKLTADMLQISSPQESVTATVPDTAMVKAHETPVMMADVPDEASNTEHDVTVADVQKFLLNAGFYKMKIDNAFGEGTKKAVIAFQASKGLKPDGIVGNQTLSAMGLV